jgi:hypothetical protein
LIGRGFLVAHGPLRDVFVMAGPHDWRPIATRFACSSEEVSSA